MTEAPTEPGGFVGDIYYGDPQRPTFGTHRWNGSEWMALASEAEALTMLLGSARARIADLTRQLAVKDCLHDSAFQAGVKLGWNFGVTGDEEGFCKATASTEHIAELKRLSALKDPTP